MISDQLGVASLKCRLSSKSSSFHHSHLHLHSAGPVCRLHRCGWVLSIVAYVVVTPTTSDVGDGDDGDDQVKRYTTLTCCPQPPTCHPPSTACTLQAAPSLQTWPACLPQYIRPLQTRSCSMQVSCKRPPAAPSTSTRTSSTPPRSLP